MPQLVMTDDALEAADAVLDALVGAPRAPHTFAIARAGQDEAGELRIETVVLTLTPRSRAARELSALVAAHRPRLERRSA